MNWLKKIKSWPIEKKRIFAFSVAVFLTILVIVFNSALNLIWKSEVSNKVASQISPISTIEESFSELFSEASPVLSRAISSSSEIINQINSTTSSLTATTSVVE